MTILEIKQFFGVPAIDFTPEISLENNEPTGWHKAFLYNTDRGNVLLLIHEDLAEIVTKDYSAMHLTKGKSFTSSRGNKFTKWFVAKDSEEKRDISHSW